MKKIIKMIKVLVILFSIILNKLVAQRVEESPFPADNHYSMNINMPDVKISEPDSYLCTARQLNPRESYIVQYEPDADTQRVHHMLLFGCQGLHQPDQLYPGHWNCAYGDLCKGMTIMYGWAKNAPAMSLPPDVGFLTGGNSSIQYVVLQMHYAEVLPEGTKDNSGLKLHMTFQRQKYITGIRLLLADHSEIPPKNPNFHIDVNCKFEESYPIHPFAYRVHTHKLGVVVSGYKYNTLNNTWTFLAKGNPQWPQAFYPLHRLHTVTNNDILAARCTYDSTEMDYPVRIGAQSTDEMCNLYIMYYTESRNAISGQSPRCVGVQFPHLIHDLPPGNDAPLPKNTELEQQAFGDHNSHHSDAFNTIDKSTNSLEDSSNVNHQHPITKEIFTNSGMDNEYKFKEVFGWPAKNLKFGQITAVTVNNDGNIVIFHRGDHVWTAGVFDNFHNYLLADEGPIEVATVIVLDAVTGLVLKQWGSKLFYMPHGLFIGQNGSYWVTDVALHQVFKFLDGSFENPVLTLGEKFVHGEDNTHFCKPASVAVTKDGEIYIADGYCNARIVRFSSDGKFLSQWGKRESPFDRNPPVGTFRVPHKVTLLEDRNLVCVADRENGRIQCFTMTTGRFRFQIQREEFNGVLYSISYAQEKGLLVAVSSEDLYNKGKLVKGFVFNVTNQRLLNVFAPDSGTFARPHDIAVLANGEETYVCEIGPNVVWKFIRVFHKSTKKVLSNNEHVPQSSTVASAGGESHAVPSHVHKTSNKNTLKPEEELTNFQTSLIIMSLLAIPVLCMVLVTVVIRLKKRGKLQHCSFGHVKGWLGGYRTPHSQDKFNLGNLLNPHKGFDPVSVEESDADVDEGSESDIEEFSAIAKKT